jgi:CrcB protein
MSVGVWLAVAALGGLGALGRFLLDGAIGARSVTRFPLGTLAVNLSGALLLGLLAGLALSGTALILAGSATLGSYTTFSTWMLESHRLTEDAEPRLALVNLIFSLLAGVGAAAAGHAIGVRL